MNKKFIYFKTKTQFTAKLSSLPNNAIVFIEDTKQIWTHGVFFDTSWDYVTGKPNTFTPSAHTLGSHSDVTLAALANGNILRYNGSKWVNNTLAQAGIATPADITTAIAGLEIGGRNLIENSNNIKVGTYPNSEITPEGWLKVSNQSTAADFLSNRGLDKKIANGEKVILSFKAKATGTTIPPEFYINSAFGYLTMNGTLSEDFSIFTLPVTWVSGGSGAFHMSLRTSGVYFFKDFKLEKGNKATDWTPAPEDQVSDWNTTDVNSFSYIKNKPSTFTPSAHTHTFASLTSKPTTLSGYGITDAYTKTQVDTSLNGKVSKSGDTMTGALRWANQNGLSPYIGQYSTDGSLLISLGGQTTSSGLVLGGTSDNLLWKGNRLFDTSNMPTLTAGNGLTGGGVLNANQTLTLGTPSTITNSTTNSVTTTSHTHSIDPSDFSVSSLRNTMLNTTTPATTHSINYGRFGSADAGNLPVSNNANAILTMSKHSGNYDSQLAFSSNGNIYYRNFIGEALNTTKAWKTLAFTTDTIDTADNLNRSIIAGNGLSGGGVMTADRTITLGTPSNITLSSTNEVTASSHTHAFVPGGTTAQYIRGDGSLATYANTTYSEITEAQTVSTSSSVVGLITGRRLKYAFDNITAANATNANILNRRGDNRGGFKPSDITSLALITTFSTQGALLSQTNNSDYVDVIGLSTYSDASAGQVNALAFDKSSHRITHFMGTFGTSSWSSNKTLAYTDGTGASGTWGINITGNAATATALTTSAGSATKPVYFSNGKPVATTYSLGASVPSNAVFTDTKYNNFTKTVAGLVPAPTGSTSTRFLREDGTWHIPTDSEYTAGTGISLNNKTFNLNTATASALGGVKLFDDTIQSGTSKVYGVQLNSSGQMVVNVPWTDTNTNTTYSAGTGLSLSGTTFNVNYGTTSGTVAQGNDSRITNGNTAYGWGNHAGAGYLTSIPLASTTVIGGGYLVNNTKANVTLSRTTTSNRYYPVQLNTSNQMMVNVPWTDTTLSYTLPIATANALGGIRVGTNLSINSSTGVLTATDTTYSAGSNISISSSNVISATNTTYSTFTRSVSGLVPNPVGSTTTRYLREDGSWVTPPNDNTVYNHPSGFGNQPTTALTNASVISQITVNTNGHVTGVTSRNLTLSNLGYTGASNANYYTHPTTDGNLHVPATGTSNSGKVLTAGSTAGSFSWQALPSTTYTAGTAANLIASNPSTDNMVWSPSILKNWIDNHGFITTDTTNTAGSGDYTGTLHLVGTRLQSSSGTTSYSNSNVTMNNGVLSAKGYSVNNTSITAGYVTNATNISLITNTGTWTAPGILYIGTFVRNNSGGHSGGGSWSVSNKTFSPGMSGGVIVRINHNIGHTDYAAFIDVQGKDAYGTITSRSTTAVDFSFTNINATHVFTIMIIGRN